MYFLYCTYHYFYLFLFFNINNMPKETPREHKSLTATQKKDVCLKKISTPSLKQKDIAKEYDVSEGMVSDILKEKDRWIAIDNDSYQANLKREKKFSFLSLKKHLLSG